jgi:hypothetical protein
LNIRGHLPNSKFVFRNAGAERLIAGGEVCIALPPFVRAALESAQSHGAMSNSTIAVVARVTHRVLRLPETDAGSTAE